MRRDNATAISCFAALLGGVLAAAFPSGSEADVSGRYFDEQLDLAVFDGKPLIAFARWHRAEGSDVVVASWPGNNQPPSYGWKLDEVADGLPIDMTDSFQNYLAVTVADGCPAVAFISRHDDYHAAICQTQSPLGVSAPDWTVMPEAMNELNGRNSLAMQTIFDRPAVAGFSGTSQLAVAWSKYPRPSTAKDWEHFYVNALSLDVGLGLAAGQNGPVVAFCGETDESRAKFGETSALLVACVAPNTQETGTLASAAIDTARVWKGSLLCSYASSIYAAYANSSGLRYAQCNVESAGEAEAWQKHTVLQLDHTTAAIGVVAGRPVIAYTVTGLPACQTFREGTYCAQAMSPSPRSAADWRIVKVSNQPAFELRIAEASGHPLVAYSTFVPVYGYYCAWGKVAQPRSIRDWSSSAIFTDGPALGGPKLPAALLLFYWRWKYWLPLLGALLLVSLMLSAVVVLRRRRAQSRKH